MDSTDKVRVAVLIFSVAIFVISLTGMVRKGYAKEDHFKAVCSSHGGEPVYNSREYVCLKP